jgi:hypothetical protein
MSNPLVGDSKESKRQIIDDDEEPYVIPPHRKWTPRKVGSHNFSLSKGNCRANLVAVNQTINKPDRQISPRANSMSGLNARSTSVPQRDFKTSSRPTSRPTKSVFSPLQPVDLAVPKFPINWEPLKPAEPRVPTPDKSAVDVPDMQLITKPAMLHPAVVEQRESDLKLVKSAFPDMPLVVRKDKPFGDPYDYDLICAVAANLRTAKEASKIPPESPLAQKYVEDYDNFYRPKPASNYHSFLWRTFGFWFSISLILTTCAIMLFPRVNYDVIYDGATLCYFGTSTNWWLLVILILGGLFSLLVSIISIDIGGFNKRDCFVGTTRGVIPGVYWKDRRPTTLKNCNLTYSDVYFQEGVLTITDYSNEHKGPEYIKVHRLDVKFCPALVYELLDLYGHIGPERLKEAGIDHLRRLGSINIPLEESATLRLHSLFVAASLSGSMMRSSDSLFSILLN